ncbi:hypothetical protein ACU4GD_05600 [Cupriavidus basilensis]
MRDGAWLVYGMRGNVLRSNDFGATWQPAVVGVKTSFFGGAQLPDGALRWRAGAERSPCRPMAGVSSRRIRKLANALRFARNQW